MARCGGKMQQSGSDGIQNIGKLNKENEATIYLKF